jgi:hypothetical protein
MLKLVNIALVIVLLLLLRKLLWCVRWLWRYYHGQEVPDPIGWLPGKSGETFDDHVRQAEEEREDKP